MGEHTHSYAQDLCGNPMRSPQRAAQSYLLIFMVSRPKNNRLGSFKNQVAFDGSIIPFKNDLRGGPGRLCIDLLSVARKRGLVYRMVTHIPMVKATAKTGS